MYKVGETVEFLNGYKRVAATVLSVEKVRKRSGIVARCLGVKVHGDNSTRGYRLINEQEVIDTLAPRVGGV